MNNKKRAITSSSIFLLLLLASFTTYAQAVKNAAQSFTNKVQFCNGITCPTSTTVQETTTSAIKSLNADMATIEDVTTANTCAPGYFGITIANNANQIWAIAFSGASNSDLGTNKSGFTMGKGGTNVQDTHPLPFWNSGITTTANDPDVAIGTCYSTLAGAYRHFVLAVYEDNGQIFLEHYDLDVSSGSPVTQPPTPFTCMVPPCTYSGNMTRIALSDLNPDIEASKPHIEIWHTKNDPKNLGTTPAEFFAVTWQQEDVVNNPGVIEVWGNDGEIDDPGFSTFPTPNGYFYIDDGKQPDVVAVNALQNPLVTKYYPAYVTYLDNNGKNVELSEWEYNTQTPAYVTTLNLNATANNNEFSTPRISGPMYYDYNTISPTDPICVVAVNDADANFTPVIDKVTAYKYYDPSLSPSLVRKQDISDHNATDGFSSSTQTAIYPVVSGVGEIASGFSPVGIGAYTNYPVAFYSDYLNGLGQDGDFYAFGLDMDHNTTTPVLHLPATPDAYWEVNYNTLNNGNDFNLLVDKPMLAIATANNTGYDLLSTFYEGSVNQNVRYSFTGTTTPYGFKPGRATGIEQINGESVAIYPNPVSTELNITQANRAEYTMMDMAGRVINSGTLSGNKATVNTSTLAAGMYLISITKDGHSEKLKFTKQ